MFYKKLNDKMKKRNGWEQGVRPTQMRKAERPPSTVGKVGIQTNACDRRGRLFREDRDASFKKRTSVSFYSSKKEL